MGETSVFAILVITVRCVCCWYSGVKSGEGKSAEDLRQDKTTGNQVHFRLAFAAEGSCCSGSPWDSRPAASMAHLAVANPCWSGSKSTCRSDRRSKSDCGTRSPAKNVGTGPPLLMPRVEAQTCNKEPWPKGKVSFLNLNLEMRRTM
jgi:hypothetical protein